MYSKSQVSLINSLQQKKYRKEHGLFIAEGEKVVAELIDSGWKIHSLYFTKAFFENTFSKRKTNLDLNYEIISEEQLSKISALTTPQSVLAVASIPEKSFELAGLKNQLSLLLDEIKDPGNLGTIIRIADWFGIENIICSENSTDAFNPKVVQASMGSIFRVNIFYNDLSSVLKENIHSIKLPVYGTLLAGKNLYKTKLSNKGLILIGNESKGISEEIIPFVTDKISIPSFSQHKKTDSLNAAMAAAIVCSEFRRG